MRHDSSKFFAELLAPLGFERYDDYLQSELWKAIRTRVYEAKGRCCIKCCGAANQIHHEQYDLPTMRGETLLHLVPICGDCHQLEHGLTPGAKKSKRQKKSPEWKVAGIDAKKQAKADKRARSKERRRNRKPGLVGKIERMLASGTKNFRAFDLPMNLSTIVYKALKEGRDWHPIVEAAIQPLPPRPKNGKCPCGRLLNLKDEKTGFTKCGICRKVQSIQQPKKTMDKSLRKPIHVPKVQTEKTPSQPLRRFMAMSK